MTLPRADAREKSGRRVFLAVLMAEGRGSRGKIDSERKRAGPLAGVGKCNWEWTRDEIRDEIRDEMGGDKRGREKETEK